MNYIRHLNGIFIAFTKDSRLNTTHISLYWALFHFANINRFPEFFHIDRAEIMKISKIGSKGTYHKCLKELHHWKYIHYSPSYNPYKGSKINLFDFGTSTGQVSDGHRTSSEQALVPNTTIYKQNRNKNENIGKGLPPKNFLEVFDFLKKEECAKSIKQEKLKKEAQKFFNHYSANGWKIGGKTPMENWMPAAENWLLKAEEFENKSDGNQKNGRKDNLHISKSKDYHQPL